ncbi:MAG: DUF1905 domain-containing protein [Proteobacteria bacterium]|nr:DUF1905 domain-containing protein [Pseudomonadota bacterium]
MSSYTFTARIWLYESTKAAWHFISVPEELSATIAKRAKGHTGGWGSVKVEVELGTSVWETSIFPSSKDKHFILPLKGDIRRKEHIGAGDTVELTLTPKLPAVDMAYI